MIFTENIVQQLLLYVTQPIKMLVSNSIATRERSWSLDFSNPRSPARLRRTVIVSLIVCGCRNFTELSTPMQILHAPTSFSFVGVGARETSC